MWTASALRVSCSGGSGAPPPGGSGMGRCVSCVGRAWVVRCPCSTTGPAPEGIWREEGARYGCSRGRDQPGLWSWSPSLWCGTPLPTATFPHGLVQSRRRIRSRGRRWRVASYQRKVVEMGCSGHLPEGPRRAGGDPAPGNVATTRLPEAGVREHPAPLGALRRHHRTYWVPSPYRSGSTPHR